MPRFPITVALLALAIAGCDSGSAPDRLAALPSMESVHGADPAVVAAVRSARERVLATPDAASSWGHLAMVLLAHDQFALSVNCFREAAHLAPDDPRWPYLQGLALLGGNPDQEAAVPVLKAAAELAAVEPAPRLKLAEVLLELGRIDEAGEQFRQALKLDAANARAHLGLGRVAYLRGDLKAAKDHLTRSASAAPRVKATRALLAELYFREGDRESAESNLRLLASLPDVHHWPDPYWNEVLERWVGALAQIERANDLYGRGRHDEAIKLLEETIRVDPNALLAHLVLGRFFLQSNRLGEAETALRRATEIAPDAFEAHHELGTALEGQGKTAEAIERFERTIAIKPEYAPAHFHLGRCRLQQGDPQGAIAALTATVRYKPDYAEAQRALGHLLAQSQRYGEAAEHLRHAVRLRPSDQKAQLLLQEVLKHVE